MTYYLGRVGALIALPDPEVGLSITPERVGSTHQLLSGARVRDTLGTTWPRTWQMQWTALDLISYGALAQFSALRGPFYLFDPEQRNLLPPNVAMGTDATQDTTGFAIGSATTIASSTNAATDFTGGPFPSAGSRTLQIIAPNALAAFSGLVSAGPYPVVAGVAYAASAYLENFATSTWGSFLDVGWLTSALAGISTTSGNTIAAGAVGRSVAAGTAPAAAAYMSLTIRNSATTGATGQVYADGFQFEAAAGASTWTPGLGFPLVTVEALSRTVPLSGICDAQMTLVQVG